MMEWVRGVIAVIFFVAITKLWRRIRALRRSRQIENSSRLIGLVSSVDDEQQFQVAARLSRLGFSLFRKQGAELANLLRTREGSIELLFFDLSYTNHTGEDSYTIAQTVGAIRLPRESLPHFHISPKHFLSDTHRSIPVIGVRPFSRRYLVFGKEPSRIEELLDVDLRVIVSAERGWTLEARDDSLFVWREGVLVKAHRLDAFVTRVMRIGFAIDASTSGKR